MNVSRLGYMHMNMYMWPSQAFHRISVHTVSRRHLRLVRMVWHAWRRLWLEWRGRVAEQKLRAIDEQGELQKRLAVEKLEAEVYIYMGGSLRGAASCVRGLEAVR